MIHIKFFGNKLVVANKWVSSRQLFNQNDKFPINWNICVAFNQCNGNSINIYTTHIGAVTINTVCYRKTKFEFKLSRFIMFYAIWQWINEWSFSFRPLFWLVSIFQLLLIVLGVWLVYYNISIKNQALKLWFFYCSLWSIYSNAIENTFP